jgi:SAM-dependent methyltransferase
MDNLVRSLPETAWVLDLGAGGGSFDYASTPASVVSIDLAFPQEKQAAAARLVGSSHSLPLGDKSVDVVICNHTFEHFEDVSSAVQEVHRVLRNGGHLWISVPNGFSFSDDLYRYLFTGIDSMGTESRDGGHVNRFTLGSLVSAVEEKSELRAQCYKILYCGFVFLNPPDPEKLPYYPSRARKLSHINPRVLESMNRWLNWILRFLDSLSGMSLSQYGWGVVFRKDGSLPRIDPVRVEELERMPTDTNVCFSCGAGAPLMPTDTNVCFSCGAGAPISSYESNLKSFLLWMRYQCLSCNTMNIFFPKEL